MNFFSLDFLIVLPIFGLIGISLSLIGSFTPDLLINQIIFYILGIIFLIFLAKFDYKLMLKLFWHIYIFSLVFLLISLFGPEIRGAHRWVDLVITRLQPSEIIKPLVIIITASLLIKEKRNNLYLFLYPLLYFLPFLLIIFKQPDLGNVIVYSVVFCFLQINAGLLFKYIVILFLIFSASIPSLWMFLAPYQKMRLLTFVNPHYDSIGAGYNALQALIAIGSGQLFGFGLGKGAQSHLLFLPEYHTDFVFAALGEELGLVGTSLVIIFYFILLFRILLIARACDDLFGKLICYGVFIQIFTQAFINIGMNLGILPITGITLPLISYGGSSIISTFIDLGLVLSIAKMNKKLSGTEPAHGIHSMVLTLQIPGQE